MPLILHKIVLATDSKLSLERVRKVLGDKSYASLTEKTTKRVNELAQLALESYQAKVPINSGQLRDSNIKLQKATPQSGIAIISVSGSHKSADRKLAARFGETTEADILADILNIGTYSQGALYKRTRDSVATGRFSAISKLTPTKGWITRARQAFAQARRKV